MQKKGLLELQKSLCNGVKGANVAGGLLINILYGEHDKNGWHRVGISQQGRTGKLPYITILLSVR